MQSQGSIENDLTTPAAIVAAATVGVAVALNATRDALFLSSFAAERLPGVVMGSAVATLLVALVASWCLERIGPERFTPAVFALSGFAIAGNAAFIGPMPRVASVALYLLVACVIGALMPAFWSLVNERVDPETGKASFATIAWASTIGSILGGVVAERLAHATGERGVIVAAAAVLLVGAGVLRTLAVRHPALVPADAPEAQDGAARSYLILLGLTLALIALGGEVVDYLFKEAASSAWTGTDLMRFFSVFYASMGIIAFVGQLVFTRSILQRLGASYTAALFPGTLAVLAGAALLVPSALTAAIVLKGGRSFARSVFHRASHELLFVPVEPSQKRFAKLVVDVGGTSLGALVGGGVLAVFVATDQGTPVLYVTVVVVGVATAALLAYVHRGYTDSLTRSVRARVEAASMTRRLGLTRPAPTALTRPSTRSLGQVESVEARLRNGLDVDDLAWAAGLPCDDDRIVRVALQATVGRWCGLLGDLALEADRKVDERTRLLDVLARGPADRVTPVLIRALDVDQPIAVQLAAARSLANIDAAERERWRTELAERLTQARPTDDESLQLLFTLLYCLTDDPRVRDAWAGMRSDDPATVGATRELLSSVLDRSTFLVVDAALPDTADVA